MDILETILAHKRADLEQLHRQLNADQCESRAYNHTRPVISMRQSLANSASGIIAEFKRRSPSKGWIHPDAQPQQVIPCYAKAGAAALSILTEQHYFGGEPDYLVQGRQLAPHTPILRKDFIVENSQIHYARCIGADAVLLIAACLSPQECAALAREAHAVGLEVFLEIHDQHKLDYVEDTHPDMVGVNNRHLGTFHTDVETSFRMAELLPKDYLLVSESGISQPSTVAQLRQAGFRGFLIGETFMREPNPGQALQQFISQIQALQPCS